MHGVFVADSLPNPSPCPACLCVVAAARLSVNNLLPTDVARTKSTTTVPARSAAKSGARNRNLYQASARQILMEYVRSASVRHPATENRSWVASAVLLQLAATSAADSRVMKMPK